MYEELDCLLLQKVTDDAWYDDGYLIAQDIMKDFHEKDWQILLSQIEKKDIEWQKKLIYSSDNQIISEEVAVIEKVLHSSMDDELFDMCIDALRTYDVQTIKECIDTDKIVEMLINRLQNKSNLEKMIYEDFITKISA